MPAPDDVLVSFVHGYQNLDIGLPPGDKPALWRFRNGESTYFNLPFPRAPEDFHALGKTLVGELPRPDTEPFKKLPRFGLTGLAKTKNHVFAGSWNAVYRFNRSNLALEAIVSNRLHNDMHGIYADESEIITILTSKDTIVRCDHEGKVIDHFFVSNDLSIGKDSSVDEHDWRFISKQFRGSCGYWHFNYVQKFGDEIWLTSRNCSSFVVVDTKKKKAWLRLMNHTTPNLLHDGIRHGNKYYFTSIDGKIIIAEHHSTAKEAEANWENPGNLELYKRDLITRLIRLNETSLGREPNWCRGIDVANGKIFVTIDGRYDSDLSFGLLAVEETTQKVLLNERLSWSQVGNEKDIRYVTGFDVLAL